LFSFFTKSIVRVFNSVVLLSIVVGLAVFTLVIGYYNYDTSMNDLRSKAKNTGDLASISLMEALWNFDEVGMQNIFTAILLDKDVVAIRVMKGDSQTSSAEKIRELDAKTPFADLMKNPSNLETTTPIMREGVQIAQVQIITSTEKVKALIRYTTLLISGFSVGFVLLLSSFIWFLGTRIIKRPIESLRESADHLAGGDLNYVINTDRNDELGSLAVSFDKMRNAIRKKLADLAVLNSAGEKLAGIHDQTEALETAIKVMSEQTKVERGSIYLLDKEKNLNLSAFYPEMKDHSTHFPKIFKLSEGIAGQVAQTGKLSFVPDVSKMPDFVATSSNQQPRALLCVPMMDDKEVFGVMNFVGEVGKVTFSEEDEGFALTIARMAVITIKNIQMLDVIEEQNRTLEERILVRTAELRQKTNDVNSMLQNMRQGIFTIVKGVVVHPEYSAFLSEIFETKEVANSDAFPFLFDQSSVGGDVLNQMEATVDSMIGEDSMNFQFNSHLLVHEFTKHFDNGRSKILELDWNPVININDTIDKLMVTVRDVTELKALQLETEKQKEELDIIGQILSVSKDKLIEFISTSNEFFNENQALIEKTEDKDKEVIATLFRNMHTIKGNARTYGLSYVADRVHEAETTYSDLRSQDDCPWDQTQLLEELRLARACVARYETVFKEKLAGFTSGEGSGVDSAVLESIALAVENVNDLSAIGALKSSLQLVRNSIVSARSESVQDVLKGIIDGVPSIAKQLEKETPSIMINDHFVRIKKDIVPMLRNVFMHVFRNSMDHGLETTAQRIAAGKSEQGHIKLDVALGEDQLAFTFSDDGKGLALGHILNKAIANGQLTAEQNATDAEIAEMIFLSGLSTATEVTNVSGRGVGMDAIRKFLNKHQGDVQIGFTGESIAKGFRPFQLIITLPSKFAVQRT
jgi:two-component system chemotaxis sensor kinase CheA